MGIRLVSVLVALVVVAPALAAPPAVEYPTGYRKWAHVKSMAIVSEKHPLFAAVGGIHHVYANPPALEALVKGTSFPDGSVLVFDLLEAKDDNGAWVEGPRKVVLVMVKDKTAYKATGGWGWESFKGDSKTERTVKDPAKECFACHQSQTKNEFVFSAYRP